MDDRYSNAQLKLVTPSAHQKLDSAPEKLENNEWKDIRRDRLINSLNRINFQDSDIVLNFRHLEYDTMVSIPAKPQPCLDHYFQCTWFEPIDIDYNFNHYRFENFYFTDGLNQTFVKAQLISINKVGVSFCLPEHAVVINARKVRRHKCTNVTLQLIQNGLIFEGELMTYSSVSFSVSIPNEISFNTQQEIKREEPIDILIIKNNTILFAGRCDIFRLSETNETKILILKPISSRIQRFKSKKFRSIRQKLNPSPNIIFYHPFTGKRVNLRVNDISGSGFSVDESFENSLLLPGMIIPALNIEFMNGLALSCKSQVIYKTSQDGVIVKCGFAFIDMEINDQIRLTSFLHQASNKNAHVCTKIDLEELWNFFFDTGFVYPKKYFYIHANRSKFDAVYRKLYEYETDIAINFTYQDKGRIYGHMSMFRFYERTWIINHHAADSSKRSRAGLVVLEQIGRYINEFHRLPSTKMEYVGCYFRPENKFPNLVFGGAARNSSEGCTIDEFAYLHLNKKSLCDNLPENWAVSPINKSDLLEFKNFYELKYGGLTLKALDIDPSKINCDKKINADFKTYGFNRERFLFALKHDEKLIAVLMICVSELGLNMSDLTNCIHVFVLDHEKLPSEILHSAISRLSTYYEHDYLPVLIFPKEYTESHAISFDKTYNFWVLDVDKSSDEYFTHVERLTKRVKKNP